MKDLRDRQEKIQAIRKQTPWRQFVMELCSRTPMMLYKNNGTLSRYPAVGRMGELYPVEKFQEIRDGISAKERPAGETVLDQIQNLRMATPRGYMQHDFVNENSEYCDIVYGAKNSYLSYCVGHGCENVLYTFRANDGCVDIVNSGLVGKQSQVIFSSYFVESSFKIFYSKGVVDCNELWFCTNMIGCSECLFCDGLENQSYCINNQKLTKEVYEAQKKQLLEMKEKFAERYGKLPRVANVLCNNVVGTGLRRCEDIDNGLYVSNTAGGSNVVMYDGGDSSSNMVDVFSAGLECHHFYGVNNAGFHMEHAYICTNTGTSNNIYYSSDFQGCSYCFGCVGLRNKSFHIFNKPYEKEERFETVDKLFTQMEQQGQLGQFFPGTMNPFYFNDTAAYLLDDSFTKEEVEAAGYLRREEEIKVDIPEGVTVISNADLDTYEGRDEQGNWSIDKEILNKVIQDEQGNYYRIIPVEYKFLKKYGLPLPRKHWLERLRKVFTL